MKANYRIIKIGKKYFPQSRFQHVVTSEKGDIQPIHDWIYFKNVHGEDQWFNTYEDALDENTANIKILSSIEELPKTVYMDGIKMSFVHNDRYDVIIFCDTYHDKESYAKWKTSPVYAFYVKDWKRLNKGINIFENNNPHFALYLFHTESKLSLNNRY